MNHDFAYYVLSLAMAKMNEAEEAREPHASDGFIQSGTYDATDGTVTFVHSDSVCNDPNDDEYGDQILAPSKVPIVTTAIGDQDGTTGGDETAVLLNTSHGKVVMFVHQPKNNVGVPVNERHITGRKRFLIQTSAGKFVDITDDGNGITLSLEGGLLVKIDGASGTIELGATGLGGVDAIMRAANSQTLANAIIANVQSAINTLAGRCASGAGVVPPTVNSVTAIGSNTARAKA